MKAGARALCLFAMVLGLPAAASAESLGEPAAIRGGIKGGVNASRWVGADGAMMHLGLGLGGFATFPLVPGLSLQPEFLMHEKGSDFHDIQGMGANEGLLYLEVPILVRADLELGGPVTGYGTAGPGVAWVIDSKRTPIGELHQLDITFGVAVGARFDTGTRHKIDVELRSSLGLLDLLDRKNNDETARNLVVGLFAGVTL